MHKTLGSYWAVLPNATPQSQSPGGIQCLCSFSLTENLMLHYQHLLTPEFLHSQRHGTAASRVWGCLHSE